MAMKPQESDVAFIKALAELLRENDLTEIEVSREYGEDDALNVRVARQIPVAIQPAAAAAPVTVQMPGPAAPQAAAPAVVAAPDPAEDPGVVISPMVGTVYLQAQPGSPPFAKVGDTLAEGQTILIIEAMKTMNQIPAPRAGRVKRILVEDGSPVEFGAPLIILE
ncbi:acetyl-CoA carboxylase biotin carboxyl carrier protein [Amaricoccus solimangrovi]|uniref:Biotin carboxyl carrier protein of acetyl-CoA carboxylase n=1 Tax=Amaricoccus solimangrovi TaxID=2589815 RepID=A0A501WTR7_9RHOB|nr:acetyl-CoA carboxylase biotin carboxyl carrier protein [Amaricoccus solimangrovi]TPE49226.1 acetyl-CoA carboxylase biotin carboxyl carrier protein [Amaricoccus solimangrovi]